MFMSGCSQLNHNFESFFFFQNFSWRAVEYKISSLYWKKPQKIAYFSMIRFISFNYWRSSKCRVKQNFGLLYIWKWSTITSSSSLIAILFHNQKIIWVCKILFSLKTIQNRNIMCFLYWRWDEVCQKPNYAYNRKIES